MSTSMQPGPTAAGLQPEPLAPPAPADARNGAPPARREAWKNAAGYVAAAAGAVAIMAVALRLWNARLDVPLHDGADNLQVRMFVQNVLESGWALDAPRLGAPGALDMRDYPIPDVLHVAIIKLMGLVWRDSAVVLNLYYLLAFPLVALSAYWVLRRWRLGRVAALTAAVLFAVLPFHFFRLAGHVFLAAYFLVPPAIWLAVRMYLGRNPFLRPAHETAPETVHETHEKTRKEECGAREPSPWRLWSWQAAGAVLLCVLVGLGGVYYAFFSCFLLMMAGVRVAFRERRWTPFLAAVLPAVLVGVSLMAALAPSLIYTARNGKNTGVADRLPAEADIYGLNASEMLLPVAGHRLAFLERMRERFLAPPRRPTPAASGVTLGVLGSIGFLYLMTRFFLRRRARLERVEDGLGYFTFCSVLLGTIGGFGSLFAFFVTPMIRCYDRISIFIAFCALAGLFLLLQRCLGRFVRGRGAAAACGAGLLLLLTLGALDQTSAQFVPYYKATRDQAESDADFGRQMEAALPPGSMVYQMPYVPFPESLPVQGLQDYELLRPLFHTKTLRFSYGAMKGREFDRWQADLASRPLADVLERLAVAGFGGVYLDRAGYADLGAATEAELSRLLGVRPLVSRCGRQTFFDMTAYARQVRGRFTEEEWEAKKEAVLRRVDVRWKTGELFRGPRPADGPDARWCGSHDQLHVQNYFNRPKHVVLKMSCAGWSAAPVRLVVDGDLAHREATLTQEHQPLELDLTVPPGDHVLTFSCDGPRLPAPADPREVIFLMEKTACEIGD